MEPPPACEAFASSLPTIGKLVLIVLTAHLNALLRTLSPEKSFHVYLAMHHVLVILKEHSISRSS